MFDSRRRMIPNRSLTLTLLLLVLAAVAGSASCGTGVSQDEFEAVQQDLAREKARSQSLEGELAQVGANIAGLNERVDKAEMEQAVLVSKLAQETTNVEGLQKKVDEAEVQQALLATFLAWNRKDANGFNAGFTDGGLSKTVLSVPEAIGERPLST